MRRNHIYIILLWAISITSVYSSQKPIRVGTTAANFLEYGYGTAGCAMGDAYVSMARDLSAIYWNPAGLGYMNQNEAMFVYQPWLVDINTTFTAAGIVLHNIGTLSFGLINVDYGEMEVTTLARQEGTGAYFSSGDLAAILSFGRRITNWFAFGISVKYIYSHIWHMKASAFATDLGVIIKTGFFSPTGKRAHGLNLGMSVSNYGTRMKYGGIDLIRPIDILPDEAGNFQNVPGEFRLQGWELPLIFRLGISVNPLVTNRQQLTFSVDAIHPNNNSEYVNLGFQYKYKISSTLKAYLRAGHKAMFMDDSQYGFSLGAGMLMNMFNNKAIQLDYSFRQIGIIGNSSSFSISILF